MKLNKSIHILLFKVFTIKKGQQSGFTLVELMVTVGIIGLMAAIGIPSVLNYLPSIRLRTAARELYTDMQRAKMESVKTNKVVSMDFPTHANNIQANCPTGSYRFTYTNRTGNVVTIANTTMQKNVCILDANFAANSGFSPDGTPSGLTVSVILTHTDRPDTVYQITQSAAGGISIEN